MYPYIFLRKNLFYAGTPKASTDFVVLNLGLLFGELAGHLMQGFINAFDKSIAGGVGMDVQVGAADLDINS